MTRYFAAMAGWAADGSVGGLEGLRKELLSWKGEEVERLTRAVDILLRSSRGEDVRQEAEEAISGGVSRTFLSLLLIGGMASRG